MHRLVVVADLVFQYKIMDKTLADYIKRATEKMNQEQQDKQKVAENRNVWNDTELASQDIYNVVPEKQNQDSDEKINPYGQH